MPWAFRRPSIGCHGKGQEEVGLELGNCSWRERYMKGEKDISGGDAWRITSAEDQAWERGWEARGSLMAVGGKEETWMWWQVPSTFVLFGLSTDSLPFPPAPSSTSSPNCHSPCRPGLSTLVSGVATQAFSLCLTRSPSWFPVPFRLVLPPP